MEVCSQFQVPAALNSRKVSHGTHFIRGCVGPRTGVDAVKRKIHCPRRESNSDSSAVQPLARRYIDCAINHSEFPFYQSLLHFSFIIFLLAS
jgi:hypothetical protein